MMKENIYLSGPISGYDLDERRLLFGKIENCLSRNGYEVFNPLKNGLPDDAAYEEHMRTDIRALTECDTIVFLPGWEHSAGCRTEFIVAIRMGVKIFLEQDKASSIVLRRMSIHALPCFDTIDFWPGYEMLGEHFSDSTVESVRTFFAWREGPCIELQARFREKFTESVD